MFSMSRVLQLCVCVSLASVVSNDAVKVPRVFLPKEHFLFLHCDGQSDVQWKHGGKRLMNVNSTKQKLFPHGTLYISDVDMSDAGLYYCNDRLVAHVTVLTGSNDVVCEGGTVYLRCTLPKQRWAFKYHADSRREFISTRFKNGTVMKERPDPDARFTHNPMHLQILNVQPLDSGTYYCSGKDVSVLTVTSESNTHHCPTPETGSNLPQRSGNVVLVAILALCVLAVVTVVLLSVIVCLKFSSKNKPKACKPEEGVPSLLAPRSHGADVVTLQSADRLRSYNDEIHYASLGKKNLRPRDWNQQSRQQVIYSTLLLSPKHTHLHTP